MDGFYAREGRCATVIPSKVSVDFIFFIIMLGFFFSRSASSMYLLLFYL